MLTAEVSIKLLIEKRIFPLKYDFASKPKSRHHNQTNLFLSKTLIVSVYTYITIILAINISRKKTNGFMIFNKIEYLNTNKRIAYIISIYTDITNTINTN